MTIKTRAERKGEPLEKRTARMTLLVDPKKKAVFEQLCNEEDTTPSQKIRQLMREYIESQIGPDWREHVFETKEQDN